MRRVSVEELVKWKDSVRKKDLFLDVGCWSGATVLKMSERCEAYGVDFNRETLKLADKRVADRLRYSDITKSINFDKKFNWALCSEVVEHIEEDGKALKNIAGAIKKGGHLVLTTPRSVRFFEFWDPAWVRWKFGGRERHWHYSLEELERKMSGAGFRILKVSTRGSFKWIVRRWVNVVLQYLFRNDYKVKNSWGNGFVDWVVLAERI
ncbi:class I SAM-dependent methyltransferase [archaeon]|jgi:SAM-dependent methyltransferase|nr:class I SAM-dependent methyltransferase [archaeon]MBT7128938.1 class I SAM-dependent methyltransferase [archaeon]